jgi:hypothetical protein
MIDRPESKGGRGGAHAGFRARTDRPDLAEAQLVPGLSDNEGVTMTHATLRPESKS